jgi:crotonobetainyl-CoA:carnitine CoA-transferase CaiB-like acyl-CoA transferase
VLDLSRLHPGAFCTRLLTDLGADVLRVEPPAAGDPLRQIPGAHAAYCHGMRSITLDMKHDRAPEVVRALVASVDVVVESSRPGALAKRGLGYDQLSADHAGLIWCSITGFGQDSPQSDRAAHDITFLGESGLLDLMRGSGDPPTPDLVLAVPFGALMATIGILAAVTERERSGRGQHIDASVVHATTWVLGEQLTAAAAGRSGRWSSSAARHVYRCADGRFVTVAAIEPRTWQALCAGLGRSELVERLGDADQAELIRALGEVFATKPAADWVALLADQGGVGPVNTVDDLLKDQHMRPLLQPVDGNDTVITSPLRFAGVDPAAAKPAPSKGEHTDQALIAAGLSAADIETLRASGAI